MLLRDSIDHKRRFSADDSGMPRRDVNTTLSQRMSARIFLWLTLILYSVAKSHSDAQLFETCAEPVVRFNSSQWLTEREAYLAQAPCVSCGLTIARNL